MLQRKLPLKQTQSPTSQDLVPGNPFANYPLVTVRYAQLVGTTASALGFHSSIG